MAMRRVLSLGVRRRHAASRALLRIARDLRAETAASGGRAGRSSQEASYCSGSSVELEGEGDEGEDEGEGEHEGEHSAYEEDEEDKEDEEDEEDKEDKEEEAREYASYAARDRCDGQPFHSHSTAIPQPFHAHHPAATPAEHFRAAAPFDAPRTPWHTGSGALESACGIVSTALSSPALSNAPDMVHTPRVLERGSSRLNVATLPNSADKPQDPHRSLSHRSLRARQYPTPGLDPPKYGNPDLEPDGPPTGTRLPTRLPERRGGASYPRRPATRTDAIRKSKVAKADQFLASRGNFAYRVVQG